MKKVYYLLLLIEVIFFCSALSAQDSLNHRFKMYNSWITLKNQRVKPLKGVLYEIRDSSIILSNSISMPDNLNHNFKETSIPCNNIILLETRRVNNIGGAALIGTALGYGSGVIFIAVASGEINILSVLAGLYIGVPFAAFGALSGALIGSIKDRIPIHGNYENFNQYRSALQEYSFVNEYPSATSYFEHRGYFETEFGISFPGGDFVNRSLISGNKIAAGTGYAANFTVGYRFTKTYGVSFSNFFNNYNLNSNDATSYWALGGLMLEPIFSFPLKKRLLFELRPGIGYANAYLVENDAETKNGNGIGINFNTSLTFSSSKRWGFLIKAGYFFTHQKFDENDQGNFQAFNLNFGIMYKFSRKSL